MLWFILHDPCPLVLLDEPLATYINHIMLEMLGYHRNCSFKYSYASRNKQYFLFE